MAMAKRQFDRKFLMKYCTEHEIKYDIQDDIKITQNTPITELCKTQGCNSTFKKTFRQLVNVSGPYCQSCTKKKCNEKKLLTMQERYGVNNPSQKQEFQEKKIVTFRKNYGCDNPSQADSIKQKIQDTTMRNHGVKCSLSSPEIREKGKQTCIDKYGYENPSQSEEIKEKMKQTNIDVRGVSFPMQSLEVRDKSKQYYLDNHGVTHNMQVTEIADKCSKSLRTFKDYAFPSGRIDRIQGYEHFALDELLKEYDENDIITMKSDVPEIWYVDEEQKHRHYVDIFIKSKQLCIEVKSTWTAEKKNDNIFLKQNAGKELGYQYEIWIYDAKGNKVKCYK
jgi:hypothetical protein